MLVVTAVAAVVAAVVVIVVADLVAFATGAILATAAAVCVILAV